MLIESDIFALKVTFTNIINKLSEVITNEINLYEHLKSRNKLRRDK